WDASPKNGRLCLLLSETPGVSLILSYQSVGPITGVTDLGDIVFLDLPLDGKAPELDSWILSIRGRIDESTQRIECWDSGWNWKQHWVRILIRHNIATQRARIVRRRVCENAVEENVIPYPESSPKSGLLLAE